MYSTSELDELFRILNSIKGLKLRQPQWSNTTEELEGPSSGQIAPAEKSIFSDRYTVEMSLEEVQLWIKVIKPKEWDLDNLDDMCLDYYCELRRQRKGLDEGDLPEA